MHGTDGDHGEEPVDINELFRVLSDRLIRAIAARSPLPSGHLTDAAHSAVIETFHSLLKGADPATLDLPSQELFEHLRTRASSRLKARYREWQRRKKEAGQTELDPLKDPRTLDEMGDWMGEDAGAIIQDAVTHITPDSLQEVARLMLSGWDAAAIAAEMGWSESYAARKMREVITQTKRYVRLRDA